MRKFIFYLIAVMASLSVSAQGKTPLVSQSSLTGISLPSGSKADKRLLSTSAAGMMMEMVSDKSGTKLKTPEVLYLPAAGQSTYNADSLIDALIKKGWGVEPISGEEDFIWLNNNGRYLMAYFKQGNKQTELYFAEAEKKPVAPLPNIPPPPSVPQNSDPNTQPSAPPVQQQTPPQELNNNNPPPPVNTPPPANNMPPPPVNNGARNSNYQFTTTNFDDGWTATEESDWVKVTKGKITVLLHYNHYKVDYSSMDWEKMSHNAWNAIVAPRYSNIKNFFMTPHMITWQTPYYMSATLTDATGEHFVAFFRRERSEWIEIIAPDKQTVEQEFKFREDQLSTYTSDAFDNIKAMYGKNYFAVAATDLPGHWTTNFFGMTQYYNSYTGLSAGATSHSSYQEFIIGNNLNYSWALSMASGWVGSQTMQSAKSNGKMTMNGNWTVHISDIEGKPRDYAVYFTAIKGARKLWIDGTGYLKK